MKGIREQRVYDAFVQDEGASANTKIFFTILSIVGELTYAFLDSPKLQTRVSLHLSIGRNT